MWKRLKICFYTQFAYPLLTQKDMGFVGGSVLQQVLLAKGLVKEGFEVVFIEFDYGQKPLEIIEGIKVFKIPSSNYTGIRRFYFQLSSLWNALERVNADIYYQRAASFETGFIALFCILKRKKFVYSVAHESDVDGTHIKESYLKGLPPFVGFLYKQLYKFGIKNATAIIAQSKHQQELLGKNFNRDGTLIKSMCNLPEKKPEKSIPPILLWVSRIEDWKQPELFLKLANAIPTARFLMIGGASKKEQFFQRIKKAAKKIPNLNFVGFVPYHEVNQYFERASIFVNTSTAEGFPNTFLQAWARYTPVVSLNVDPDEIICKYKLGFHSKTFEQLVVDVKILLDNKYLREEMGMNARRYIEEEHGINKIVEEYINVIDKICGDAYD